MAQSFLSAATLPGIWRLLRCDAPLEIQSGTMMRFAGDGTLLYVVPTPSGEIRVPMRWTVSDGVLHTMLEDGSNPVSVQAAVGEADVLVFDFGGARAFFVRSTGG